MSATAPSRRRRPVSQATDVVNVIAESPKSLQASLDRAEAQTRAAAAMDRRGIRITRRSVSLYTVETTPDVPYGITEELDRWHGPHVTWPRAAGDVGAL
jgi:hypothetical protein